MRQGKLIIVFTALITAAGTFAHASRYEVRGRVTGGGASLAGVIVSDGENVVVTEEDGGYTLECGNDSRFVFVSTPAGYRCGSQDGVIKFYRPLDRGRTVYDFELIPKEKDDRRHGFVAVADPQVLHEKEFPLLERAVEDIARTVGKYEIPFHGIGCGDIVFDRHEYYPLYNSVMSMTGLEFYNSVGNHDMTYGGRSHETSLTDFENVYGPSYYSYNVGEVHYVVLNDCFYIGRDFYYIGYLEEKQLRWLEKDLGHVPHGSTVILTIHIPTTLSPADREGYKPETISRILTNKEGLYKLLEPYNVHILSGHMHTNTNQVITGSMYEHNIAAVSGAWWQGPLCTDGTPAGYVVFTVDGPRVEWRYKSVGYPDDYQLRVYTPQEVPDYEGYVVANIWNADDNWTITADVNGERVPMEKFSGIDPRVRELYSDTSLLDHKWIYPAVTDHLYRVPVGGKTKKVKITVLDNFGNIYEQTVKLK